MGSYASTTTVLASLSNLTCAQCGSAMAQGPRSLPQGQATCHPCRRAARQAETEQAERRKRSAKAKAAPRTKRTCPTCKSLFPIKNATQRFCSQRCWQTKSGITPPAKRPRRKRPNPKASTTARGYGAPHQIERRRWARLLAQAGSMPCARRSSRHCIQTIRPGDDWHLDHSDDRSRYLGPSCVPCNTSAGVRKANANRRAMRTRSRLRW